MAYHWRTLAWIRVSHICRHWRNVALGCPALWSHPNFFMSDSVPEMLLRSKSAPLTIRLALNYGASKVIEAFHTSLEHVARIRELSLATAGHNFERLFPRTDQAAPHLHKLILNNLSGQSLREIIILPEDFLDGNAPCLSHLELKDFHLPWSSPLLKNLTTLKLTCLNSQTTLLPTSEQLVEVLGRMPGLETLELKNFLPSSSSSLSEVTLPRLQDVLLGGDVAGCANVLNLISFPSTARMGFEGMVDRHATSALDMAPLFLPTLSKIRRGLCEDDVISSLSISFNLADITIRSVLNAISDQSEQDSWLTISLRHPANVFSDKSEAVGRFLEALAPLTQVSILQVHASEGTWAPQTLEALAATFDSVHTLRVEGGCSVDFLQTMSILQDNDTRVSVFPVLESDGEWETAPLGPGLNAFLGYHSWARARRRRYAVKTGGVRARRSSARRCAVKTGGER
ncbi:hypothetical protein K435DRAFT_64027 [Dendrothele bispora CBS 962.96]|uniref:F-box domain-containing protein n=1 Tax=Dendrothele bispora (strain CBS 962.96) TaxID=1314807 RepID=A0A4S8KRG4_DENBC|nr:hypothetical protein K435DRAFT_64027 [Dendrothele bispora CBS 962.96]